MRMSVTILSNGFDFIIKHEITAKFASVFFFLFDTSLVIVLIVFNQPATDLVKNHKTALIAPPTPKLSHRWVAGVKHQPATAIWAFGLGDVVAAGETDLGSVDLSQFIDFSGNPANRAARGLPSGFEGFSVGLFDNLFYPHFGHLQRMLPLLHENPCQ